MKKKKKYVSMAAMTAIILGTSAAIANATDEDEDDDE